MNIYTSTIIVFFLMASIAVVKYYYPSYKDDNVIEEKVEKVVQLKTGLDMDLTPTSKE
jgi:hypothetical protein